MSNIACELLDKREARDEIRNEPRMVYSKWVGTIRAFAIKLRRYEVIQ